MEMDNDALSVSSTLAASRREWDVFLSFRGEDTRHPFTYELYNSLKKHGVRVFRDDEGLSRGDEIASSLLEAIEDSAASIVIISPNYASSRWCLQELSKICDCRRLILPVFYKVKPSDVRRQLGPFEGDFKKHEDRFGKEEVSRWREAMGKAGGTSGWVFDRSDEDQPQLIQLVVKRVLAELAKTPMGLSAYTVGLDFRLEEVTDLLDVRANGVRAVGLYGMGGVGKTTLAKALCNKLVGRFECLTLVSFQNERIHDLSSGNVHAYSIAKIKEVVQEKRVLLVLDDISNISQLGLLSEGREWFGEGSRIIITTRDREVLSEDLVNAFYEVRELGHSEALQLFSYHALRREKPTDKLFDLSKQMVSLTGGLPLALEVFGSFLYGKRRIEEWKDALKKLEQIRPHHVQDVLKISFNGLDEQEKCIFLDIACLFIKMQIKREDVIDILRGCGFMAETAIGNLTEKSLIKITEDYSLWMHDQVRDMGRQIVIEENPAYPGMRSRLWDRAAIMAVLKGEKGTGCIQGIVLDFDRKPLSNDPSGDKISWENLQRAPSVNSALTYVGERYRKHLQNKAEKEKEVVLQTKSLESMVNLRLLQINNTRLEGGYKHFPAQLKWLQWRGCPLKSLPADFVPRELAVLDLSESKIEQVWGWGSNKVAGQLMVLNLRGCHNLTALPHLSGNQKLEKLVLEHCPRLIKIPESIGNLSTLLHLNLGSCSNLIKFPAEVSGLKKLENLILSGCSKLKELPNDIGSMRSLKELLVDETAIAELPESIFRLTKLEKLSLNRCQFLKRLPNCIGKLSSLKEFSLNGSAIEEIPYSIGSLSNLEKLSLMWCQSLSSIPDSVGKLTSLAELLTDATEIKELPASIGLLSYLKDLSVGNCRSLSKLPDSIGGLASLVELQLDWTPISNLPDQVGDLKMLRKLAMRNCRNLVSLPESIGRWLALTSLTIFNANISELPESFGMLENLIILRLNKCTQLRKLPASIGELKSLHHLLMEETAVTELPENFGMLSRLMILKMAKKPGSLAGNSVPEEVLTATTEERRNPGRLPTSFSNLCLLEELNARAWKLSGKIPDDFEKLSSLEILNLEHNSISSLPSSLRGLCVLKKLLLRYCEELKSLPPLPSSLVEVDVANCIALERVSDLSSLENLQELNLTNCEKVVDIPGLQSLKSLRRLFMSGCKTCSSVVKGRLSKVSLRNLNLLGMPGSKIPDWFSQEVVRFSERKNREIKGVIIGAVLSLNHQIPDDLRDQLPSLPCIRANIDILDKVIFSTMPELKGVPKTQDDHIFLIRYPACHPLISKLTDGYRIRVTQQDPPYIKGIEVKQCGLYLIFEGDDDYEGDEESLDETQLSISEKLSKFFRSTEEEDHISESGSMDERRVQVIEEPEESEGEPFWWGFLRFIRGCFCL